MQGVYIKENSPKNKPTVVRSCITNLLYGMYIIQCCILLHVHEDEGLLSQVKTQVVHLSNTKRMCDSIQHKWTSATTVHIHAGRKRSWKPFSHETLYLKNYISTFWKLCLHCYITNCLNTIKVFHDFISSQSKDGGKFPVHFSNLLPGGIKVKTGIQVFSHVGNSCRLFLQVADEYSKCVHTYTKSLQAQEFTAYG